MPDARQDVADRYAGAFFDLATEEGATDAVERDMKAVRAAISESTDLRRLVSSPVFETEEKAKGLDAVLDRLGAHRLTRNLMALMVRNGRAFALDGVAKAFLDRAAKARGEVSAEAVSAHALTQEQEQALRAQIEGAVGKQVNLATRVDPSLLGGLIVKVGSRMMDSSLKTKLARLQARLTEA
jgi:F-type H+-transporting ATPase subunit delta